MYAGRPRSNQVMHPVPFHWNSAESLIRPPDPMNLGCRLRTP